MEKIVETKNLIAWFDKDRQLLKTSWTSGKADITESEIKEGVNLDADLISKYRPKFFLADESQKQFIYNVDIQNWIATTLLQASLAVGLKKFAIIMPKDLISELSTEQTVEEVGKVPIEIKYFYDEVSATQWLFE